MIVPVATALVYVMFPCQMARTPDGINEGDMDPEKLPSACTVNCCESMPELARLKRSTVTIAPFTAGLSFPFTSVGMVRIPWGGMAADTEIALGSTVCAFRSTPPTTNQDGWLDP